MGLDLWQNLNIKEYDTIMTQLICKLLHSLYLPALHKPQLLPICLIIWVSDSRRLCGPEESSDNNSVMLQSFTAVFNTDIWRFSPRDQSRDPRTLLDSLRLCNKQPIKTDSKPNNLIKSEKT